MRIARAEVIPYALPFREPYVTARGKLEQRELILFRLTSDEGAVGLGETTSLSLRGGLALAAIGEELEEIGRRLPAPVGERPRAGRGAGHDGDGGGDSADEIGSAIGVERFSPQARCAYAMAAADLALRLAGQPFAESPEPVPCNATLSTGRPGEVAEAALGWAERGFETFKLKLGAGDDVAQVQAVRDALGAEAKIRVDANGAWSVDDAVAILRELEPLHIELCEQPVATLEEMAAVREQVQVPIAADESVVTREDAQRARELGAADLLTLKLAKIGGHAEALNGDWSLPVYISSALDGSIGIAMAGSVAAALHSRGADAGIAHGLATQLLFSETIAAKGPEVRDGMLHLPGGPGLGVEIDEDALERLRLPE